jgi:hypothetical protein
MVRPSTQLRRMLGLAEEGRFENTSFRGNVDATRTLIQLLGAVAMLLVFTVLTPLALRGGTLRQPGWLATLGYFACLGLGFIVIEIGLLQRLILLLGQPVYALAVILSTMLLASGCGSFVAARLGVARLRTRLGLLLAAAAALVAAYALFLPDVIDALLGHSFRARLACAVALVALPGFLLGMPFPSGIRALESAGRQRLVPWVWGINGASVSAIIVAIELGYTAVFLLGAACYGLAAWLLQRWPDPALARARQ